MNLNFITHPNLDNYTSHIVLTTVRKGNNIYIKYILKNQNKAKYTYDYFQLKSLEVDNINQAQGTKSSRFLNEKISTTIRNSLLSLLTRI